jgi:hypothetical protein
LTRPGYHPLFFPGNFGGDPVFIYLRALAFRILGQTPTIMRGLAALIGTLTIPTVDGLGQELLQADSRVPQALPWLAVLALAVLRWHVLFSSALPPSEPHLVAIIQAQTGQPSWTFGHPEPAGRSMACRAICANASASGSAARRMSDYNSCICQLCRAQIQSDRGSLVAPQRCHLGPSQLQIAR